MNINKLDVETQAFLQNNGWYPNRDESAPVQEWESFFANEGFHVSEAARMLLRSLGGLCFHQKGPGLNVSRTGFHFDPTLAAGELDRIQAVERVAGERLTPVGEEDEGRLFIAVTESGRLVSLMDDAWVLGDTIEDGITHLVKGIRGTKLDPPIWL